jgi:phospholipid-binding lipoprotein MlaA
MLEQHGEAKTYAEVALIALAGFESSPGSRAPTMSRCGRPVYQGLTCHGEKESSRSSHKHKDDLMKANMSRGRFVPGRAAALAMLLALGACTAVPTNPAARATYHEANDPAEPTNRVIFDGNQWVDRNALQPVARTYQAYVPGGVRNALRNFSQNLKGPVVLVNDVLQGNMSRAWTTTQRFVVNTTVGGAGLFDVASDWELPAHEADFGQTLGVWGVGPGPTVQLPLFGPSNLRDAAGTAFGFLGDPVGYVPGIQVVQVSGSVVDVVDGRARMLRVTDDLEKNSIDYYAVLRSLYRQRRTAFIAEGKAGGLPADGNETLPTPTPTP